MIFNLSKYKRHLMQIVLQHNSFSVFNSDKRYFENILCPRALQNVVRWQVLPSIKTLLIFSNCTSGYIQDISKKWPHEIPCIESSEFDRAWLNSAKRALASQVQSGGIGKKKGASYNVCEYEQPWTGRFCSVHASLVLRSARFALQISPLIKRRRPGLRAINARVLQ